MIRRPSVFITLISGNKLELCFVPTVAAYQSMRSIGVRSIALGEAGVAMGNGEASKASYSQLLRDNVLITESWLIHHKVNSFNHHFDRNMRFAILFTLFVLGAPTLLIFMYDVFSPLLR